jgi:hypothetical protein
VHVSDKGYQVRNTDEVPDQRLPGAPGYRLQSRYNPDLAPMPDNAWPALCLDESALYQDTAGQVYRVDETETKTSFSPVQTGQRTGH